MKRSGRLSGAIRFDSAGLQRNWPTAKRRSAATEHTRKMGVDGYFAHASFDATPFWKRIARWYPSRGWRSWSVGENLLYDSPDATAQASLRLWLDSPPHRKNLLDPGWRQIGVSAVHFNTAPGTYDSRQVTIVTADFGARR